MLFGVKLLVSVGWSCVLVLVLVLMFSFKKVYSLILVCRNCCAQPTNAELNKDHIRMFDL